MEKSEDFAESFEFDTDELDIQMLTDAENEEIATLHSFFFTFWFSVRTTDVDSRCQKSIVISFLMLQSSVFETVIYAQMFTHKTKHSFRLLYVN